MDAEFPDELRKFNWVNILPLLRHSEFGLDGRWGGQPTVERAQPPEMMRALSNTRAQEVIYTLKVQVPVRQAWELSDGAFGYADGSLETAVEGTDSESNTGSPSDRPLFVKAG